MSSLKLEFFFGLWNFCKILKTRDLALNVHTLQLWVNEGRVLCMGLYCVV